MIPISGNSSTTTIPFLYFDSASDTQFIPPAAHVCRDAREVVQKHYEVVKITAYPSTRYIWFNPQFDTLVYQHNRRYWNWQRNGIRGVRNVVFACNYSLQEYYLVEVDVWIEAVFKNIRLAVTMFPTLTNLYLSYEPLGLNSWSPSDIVKGHNKTRYAYGSVLRANTGADRKRDQEHGTSRRANCKRRMAGAGS